MSAGPDVPGRDQQITEKTGLSAGTSEALVTLTYVRDRQDIVAIAMLTREDVRNMGSSLKLVFKADHTDSFADLLRALDTHRPVRANLPSGSP